MRPLQTLANFDLFTLFAPPPRHTLQDNSTSPPNIKYFHQIEPKLLQFEDFELN